MTDRSSRVGAAPAQSATAPLGAAPAPPTTRPQRPFAPPRPWHQLWLLGLMAAIGMVTVPDPSLAISILIYGLWAASANLLLGYGGLVSFGHALPFGWGGYTAGLVLVHVAPNAWLALAAAFVGMGLLSLLAGAVCLRRTSVYFSMLTLAFAQLGFFIALQWRDLTGGDDGLSGIPRSTLALPGVTLRLSAIGDPLTFFLVTAVIVVVVIAFLILYTDSPLGRALEAIRESQERAAGCGYNTRVVQLITFALAGGVAGLAGGLLAMLNSFVGLSPYWLQSGVVLVMVILGGRGSLLGPFLGAAAFLLLQHYLSQNFSSWQLVVGVIFVTCVLAFPQGLWGLIVGSGDRRGLRQLLIRRS